MCCFVLNVTFSLCFIDKRCQPRNLIEIRNVAINEDKIAKDTVLIVVIVMSSLSQS